MPALKIDHIVSFSSEDSTHVANNVLNNDPTKKWKSQTVGEKAASIILQLEKASTITNIDIGNEHSAYVEVLVSRSSTKDDFKVLLVMSSFMTPLEARQSTNINKVRMFSYNELQSPERDQKWDRVKVICTQPFNRRVQYGLSFITLHSSELKDVTTTIATATNSTLKLGNFTLRPSSPDNLSIGSLFSRRKELSDNQPLKAAAAIREASSSTTLLQESSKCKPQLKGTTPTSTSKQSTSKASTSDTPTVRNRNELLYNKDEEEHNTKIDKLVDQKNKEFREKQERADVKNNNKKQTPSSVNTGKKKETPTINKRNNPPNTMNGNQSNADISKRKLNFSNTPNKKTKSNKITKPFYQLLDGVIIAISGIQNPERATIRNQALAMGAKYKPDWDNYCTHLVCAYTNTPKFRQVQGKGKIVNRIWIQDCHTQRKRIPWRTYALDTKDQNHPESEDEICEEIEVELDLKPNIFNINDDTDTEDEIDRIESLQKAKNKLSENCYSVETDEDICQQKSKSDVPELPNFLSNKILYIDTELSESNRALLVQYITAFNGMLVDEPSDVVDYAVASPKSSEILKTLCPDSEVVKSDWIWECHNSKRLVSTTNYKY